MFLIPATEDWNTWKTSLMIYDENGVENKTKKKTLFFKRLHFNID